MSVLQDLEKAGEEVVLPQSEFLRILSSLERSVSMLSQVVRNADVNVVSNRSQEQLLRDFHGLDDVELATTAGSETQMTLSCHGEDHSEGLESLEQWWTNTDKLPTGNLHPWKSPDLSRVKPEHHYNKILSQFEKWLVGYGRSILRNSTPLNSLILYRLETNNLALIEDASEEKDGRPSLEAAVNEKLKELKICAEALRLAYEHQENGLWNLSLGDIIARCYQCSILPRQSDFEGQSVRRQLALVVKALELINVQNAAGPNLARLASRHPHHLTVGEVFEPVITVSGLSQHRRQDAYSADTFTGANLTLASLVTVGGIKVVWTEYLSEHLNFDIENNLLSIYWFAGTTRAKWFKGDTFDLNDLHLRNTYALLFPTETTGARATYRTYWRIPPPWWICEYYSTRCAMARGSSKCSTWAQLKALFPRAMHTGEDIWTHIGPFAATYRDDAPFEKLQLFDSYGVYADRLRVLDAHMKRWKPKGLLGLWRDNRDSYQWWTLWAVIFFGGFALLVAVLGFAVNVAQMVAQFQSLPE